VRAAGEDHWRPRGHLTPLAVGRWGGAVASHPTLIAHLSRPRGRPFCAPGGRKARFAAALRSAGRARYHLKFSVPAIGRGLLPAPGIKVGICHRPPADCRRVTASLQGGCGRWVAQQGSRLTPKVAPRSGVHRLDQGTHLGVGRPGSGVEPFPHQRAYRRPAPTAAPQRIWGWLRPSRAPSSCRGAVHPALARRFTSCSRARYHRSGNDQPSP